VKARREPTLTENEAELYRSWIDNRRRLEAIVAEMEKSQPQLARYFSVKRPHPGDPRREAVTGEVGAKSSSRSANVG